MIEIEYCTARKSSDVHAASILEGNVLLCIVGLICKESINFREGLGVFALLVPTFENRWKFVHLNYCSYTAILFATSCYNIARQVLLHC